MKGKAGLRMAAEIMTSIVISMGGVLQRVKWRCRTTPHLKC